MANRVVQGRVQQKTDTSANWALATNFIPLKGEVIVYSDLNKIKVGDGTTTINNLKFLKAGGEDVRTVGTLLATGWVDNTYSFEPYYPSSVYNVTISLASTATEEEFKAFGKAGLTGNLNSNVVTAVGVVPTIDIPILITASQI